MDVIQLLFLAFPFEIVFSIFVRFLWLLHFSFFYFLLISFLFFVWLFCVVAMLNSAQRSFPGGGLSSAGRGS